LESLAGFGGRLVTARLMPPAEVGRVAELCSGFILIGDAAQLHIGVGLLSSLPSTRRQTARAVLRTVAVVGPPERAGVTGAMGS
jgi:hypothetical protein